VHHESGWLVHDDHVIVFIQDVYTGKAARFRLSIGPRLGQKPDLIARVQDR